MLFNRLVELNGFSELHPNSYPIQFRHPERHMYSWRRAGTRREKEEWAKGDKTLYLHQPFQRCALKPRGIPKYISRLYPILNLIFAGLKETYLLPKSK